MCEKQQINQHCTGGGGGRKGENAKIRQNVLDVFASIVVCMVYSTLDLAGS